MKISFHGAAGTVTGSKHLLHLDNGKKILLDCGLFQGRRKESDVLNRHWGFEPRDIDYVLLSHAHIDHCGLLPKLVKDGFSGKIFCTPATYDLCSIMLPDSAFIQEGDARFENKHRAEVGKPLVEPLYTVEDATDCLSYFEQVEFDAVHSLPDCGLEFQFIENGHLLGSGSVNITVKAANRTVRIAYTGDIGRMKPNMLREPQPFPQADYILSESTYGDRLHDDEHYTVDDLIKLVRETCVEKRGKLIIPAFSIGRTQEILFALDYLHSHSQLPQIDVYVDSPLSSKGTTIHRKHLGLFNAQMQEYFRKDPTPFAFPDLHFIESVDQSKALNTSDDPCIIISASGMMEAGRIRHHLLNHIDDPRNTLLIVGYCEPSTLGGKILAGADEVKIFGQYKKVKARVEYVGSFSGHGDYKEMLHFLACQKPEKVKKVFLVHGDDDAQLAFRNRLKEAGFPQIEIPQAGTSYEL